VVGFIIGMVIIGLIAGYLARAIVPGSDPLSVVGTIVLGIVGAFVGGFLADALFSHDGQAGIRPVGLIGSTIGAIICLLVYRAATGRNGRRTYV
jgi:uncharacterized membrane protein YeaQ/YmgE (transglycosylase-associated protein family)